MAELARRLGGDWGGPVEERVVEHALRRLGRARLLREPLPAGLGRGAGRLSRRDWMRRAAIALPVLASIVAPTALQAASCPANAINPSQCKPTNPQFTGCCCGNNKRCTPADRGNCSGAHC